MSINKHPRICISAGHGMSSRVKGKKDPGARVVTKPDKPESDFALNFAKSLVADFCVLLRERGYVMLRDGGYYSGAPDDAAKHACDFFLEVHLNSGGGTGTEVLYNSLTDAKLAHALSESVASALCVRDRGAKRRTDLAVLKPHGMSQLLIELWFADNKLDLAKHNERRDKEVVAVLNTYLKKWGWKTISSRPSKWSALKKATYKPF